MDAESIRVTRSVAFRVARSSCGSRARAGRAASTRTRSETRVEALLRRRGARRRSPPPRSGASSARPGPVLRAVAQDERSASSATASWPSNGSSRQLREALNVERRRVPTQPTAASRERRLEDKRRRAETKRLRRDTGTDDGRALDLRVGVPFDPCSLVSTEGSPETTGVLASDRPRHVSRSRPSGSRRSARASATTSSSTASTSSVDAGEVLVVIGAERQRQEHAAPLHQPARAARLGPDLLRGRGDHRARAPTSRRSASRSGSSSSSSTCSRT